MIKVRLTTRVINHQLELIRELNLNRGDLLGVTRHFDIYTFYRYNNNKDLVRDMTSGAFVFPVVTLIQEAPRHFIASQPERGTELMLQDSREEPPKVISKPCYLEAAAKIPMPASPRMKNPRR